MNNNQLETLYKGYGDGWEQVTVGILIETLKRVPEDYEVSFDGVCGSIYEGL